VTLTTSPPAALDQLIPPQHLAEEIDGGWVTRKTHPTLPLTILTYSRGCQYDRHWTEATTKCRGLIVEDSGRIVAWCLPKFFNHSEHEFGFDYAPPLPADEPFEIFDKEDGSLGLIFHYAGTWRLASKGSFISEQAQWGQRWLNAHDTGSLDPACTYLAEILYPENRIVVNNGDEQTLVLLAVYGPNGVEQRLERGTGRPGASWAAAWCAPGRFCRSPRWCAWRRSTRSSTALRRRARTRKAG
jgi:RNA ligase